jgi:putative membrane protein
MDKVVFLPAIIHIYIFILESFLWDRPRTRKVFGLSSDEARITRLFAWNQGFYNLLLALSIIAGWSLRHRFPLINNAESAGTVLMLYGLVSIIVAGIVLYVSAPRLWRSALLQIVPAVIGLSVLTV